MQQPRFKLSSRALSEIYLAGISIARSRTSRKVRPNTVSSRNKIYAKIEAWHNRSRASVRISSLFDGIVMKRSWAGEVRNVHYLASAAASLGRTQGAPPTGLMSRIRRG
jgi:putative transposase